MKKIDIYPNKEVIYASPPEPIDENEPVCLVYYMLPRSEERTLELIYDNSNKIKRAGR